MPVGRGIAGESRPAARLLVLAAAVALIAAFADVPAARFLARHGATTPKLLNSVFDGVTSYGQTFVAIVAALLVAKLDPAKRKTAVLLLLAVIVTAAVTNFSKMATGRARPGAFMEGREMWTLLGGFGDSRATSFPSAHAASAFAFAAVLAAAYPRAARLFFALAVLCSADRVLTLRHYLSDTVAGAALGLWMGQAVLRWRWTGALAGRLARAAGGEAEEQALHGERLE